MRLETRLSDGTESLGTRLITSCMGTPPLLATSRSMAAVMAVVAYRCMVSIELEHNTLHGINTGSKDGKTKKVNM